MLFDKFTPSFCIENHVYKGFINNDSFCNITAWPKKNIVIVTHVKDGGTSPMLMAEYLAQKISSELKIKPKKLVWINHVPPECSSARKDDFTLVTFSISKDKQSNTIFENADFVDIKSDLVEAYLKGIIGFKKKHKISFSYYIPWL